MSTADVAAFSIGGVWDRFDQTVSIIESIEDLIRENSDEFGEEIEFHPGHIHSPGLERRMELQRAKEMIHEARLISQRILSEI